MQLKDLATARSGDKGNHANIGIVAKDQAAFDYLHQHLTSEKIATHFAALEPARVQRFVLPRVGAFNFLLHDVLAGGGSRSLRIDSQGKLLGISVLELDL